MGLGLKAGQICLCSEAIDWGRRLVNLLPLAQRTTTSHLCSVFRLPGTQQLVAILGFGLIISNLKVPARLARTQPVQPLVPLETHSRGLCRSFQFFHRTLGLGTSKCLVFARQRLSPDDWEMVLCRPFCLQYVCSSRVAAAIFYAYQDAPDLCSIALLCRCWFFSLLSLLLFFAPAPNAHAGFVSGRRLLRTYRSCFLADFLSPTNP